MKVLPRQSARVAVGNAVYKAIIAADQDNETDAQKAYERLVTFDPEISDTKEAKNEIVILLEELEEIRTGE